VDHRDSSPKGKQRVSEQRTLQRRKRRDRRREKRKSRPNMPAFRILNFLARVLLKNLFNVKPENVEVVNREHGPMLLMGNHSSVLDPFIVAIFIRRPVQYVISDSQIRSPFLSFLLGLVGVIPKTKVVADLDTVKRIVAVKRENGIIGIFPEGQSSWGRLRPAHRQGDGQAGEVPEDSRLHRPDQGRLFHLATLGSPLPPR
jgi:1-acyl-sn-glycerol-3-phosphate acyltransferase